MQAALEKLGDIIKQQRLSLRPADVGLPQLPGRVHSLTQQEAAVLSGVSVRWLAALEKGQYRGDATALARVMAVLQFSTEEKDDLLKLAGWSPKMQHRPSEYSRKDLQTMLDGLSHPAYITDLLWERVCWNKAAARLFSHWLGNHGQHTNLLDYLLLDPHSRIFIADWHDTATPWIAYFLEHIRFYQDEEAVAAFVAQRRNQSPFFDKLCRQHEQQRMMVSDYSYRFMRAKSYQAYRQLAFPVYGAPGHHLTVWLPVEL